MKAIHKLINSSRDLTRLSQQLATQEKLLRLVRSLLPHPLEEHCESAILHKRELHLLTDSPVWASRLRYLSRNLQQKLRQKGVSVMHVKVSVCLKERAFLSKRKPREAAHLSPGNAELLRSLGESMQDKGLREALLRLSRHATED